MIDRIKKDLDYLYTNIVPDNYFVELVQIHMDDDTKIKTYYISSKYNENYDGAITLRYNKLIDNSFVYDGKEIKEPRKGFNINRYDKDDKLIYTYSLYYDKKDPLYAERTDKQKFYHINNYPLAEEIITELNLKGIKDEYIFGWAVKTGFLSIYIQPKYFYDVYREDK